MAKSLALVNFIISQVKNKNLSIMAINRAIFFLNASQLVRHNKPLISQPFFIGQYGPYETESATELRKFGAFIDTTVTKSISIINPYTFKQETPEFDQKFKNLDELKQDLKTLLEIPNKIFIVSLQNSELMEKYQDTSIDNDDIYDFFNKFPEFQLWRTDIAKNFIQEKGA